MRRFIYVSAFVFASVSLIALSGCTTPAGKDAKKTGHKDPETGPHGGPYAEWDGIAGEDYHVEFTVDHTAKQATLYVLDEHCEKSPTKLDPKKIAKVKLTITSPKKFTVELSYDEAKSAGNKGFAFVGKHDDFAEKGDYKGSIDGTVDGVPASGTFPNHNYKKPDAAKGAKLRELYLKPGGIYTEADIKANGYTTPDQKFAGKIWMHPKKKPGDKVCPVTDNRAEPDCYWIVNGQRYEFCCTPCVDNFIDQAHHEPSVIKPAKEYVYNGS